MTRVLRLPLAAAMAWTLLHAPALAQAQAEVWDMPTEQAQTSLTGEANLFFARRVAERTNGAITIRVHFGGALGYRSTDQYDAVTNGAVVLADTFTGPIVGYDPIWQVSALPFLTRDVDEAWRLYQASKATYEAILARDGQLLLYTIPWPASGIWARKPVTRPADLAGLRIRAFDPVSHRTLAAAGARPTTLTFADVVPQLTTGGIEAVLTSTEGGYHNKFTDLLSHFTVINYAIPLSIVHMNRRKWDSLPAAQREAVAAAAAETEAMIWQRLRTREAEVMAKMREAGTTIVEATPELQETFRKAAETAIAEWLNRAGPRGQAILAAYRR